MKKIISLFTVIVLAFGILTVPPFYAAAEQSTSTGSKSDILIDLGILSGQTKSTYEPFNRVKKYEFVNYVYCLLGDFNPGRSLNAEAAEYLETRKIIDDASSITSSESVTVEQAAKMLVVALGYGDAAQNSGGYPAGFFTFAHRLGLLKGVSTDLSENLKMYDAVTMLYNAIECDVAVPIQINNETVKYESYKGTGILDYNRGIYKVKGQVTADYYTTLYSESNLREKEIRIDDTVYSVPRVKTEGLFGYPVTAFVKESRDGGEKEILYIGREESRYTSQSVEAEDIAEVSADVSQITYWDSNGRTKAINLNMPKVILNGQVFADYTAETLKPESGSITLLDSNKSGNWDIVFVDSIETVLLANVNTTQKRIYNKFSYEGAADMIDLNTASRDGSLVIKHEDDEVKLSDLAEWDVLSVRRSKGTQRPLVKIEVFSDRLNGKAEAINKTAKTVTVSGREYILSETYRKAHSAGHENALIDIGKEYDFYLNSEKEIVAVKTVAATDLQYGYALKVGASGVFDLDVKIRIFTPEQEWLNLDFAETLEHNGVHGKKAGEVYQQMTASGAFEPSMIQYQLNSEGKIIRLETPIADNNDYSGGRLRQMSASGVYRHNDNSFDSKYYLSSAVYWLLPDAEYKYDEQSYGITRDRLSLEKDLTYSFTVYNLDEYSFSNHVAVNSRNANSTPKGNFFVVSEVAESVDSEGMIVQTMTGGYQDYDKVMFKAETEGQFDNIHHGDVLTIKPNRAGVIPERNGLVIQYCVKDEERLKGGDNYTNFTCMSGKVVKSESSRRRFKIDLGDGQITSRRMLADPYVFIFNTNSDVIERGTLADMQKDDFIVYREFWATITDIVIIR